MKNILIIIAICLAVGAGSVVIFQNLHTDDSAAVLKKVLTDEEAAKKQSERNLKATLDAGLKD